jgi:CRP/FNR family transcriptional regulator, cyclic AMP receptor protein
VQISRKGKTDLLRKLPLFSECSKRELEAVAAVTDELRLPAGRVLMREGETGRELVVLVEGEVAVERGGNALASRGAGDFLGELALITHRPRTATVTTTVDTRLLVISGRDFDRLVRDVPTIALKVLKAVGERLPTDDPSE